VAQQDVPQQRPSGVPQQHFRDSGVALSPAATARVWSTGPVSAMTTGGAKLPANRQTATKCVRRNRTGRTGDIAETPTNQSYRQAGQRFDEKQTNLVTVFSFRVAPRRASLLFLHFRRC
jgi:hypothetical protein